MEIAADLIEQIVDHARREAPNECCGFIRLDGGDRAVEVLPVENKASSPLRFEVGPSDLLRLAELVDDGGAVIYHSHTRSEPRPSQTDINFAAGWPGVDWLIVGLAGEEPELRHWRIADGAVTELEIRRA
jgi:proteasome lid subunit RPN8/RPN11